MLTQTINQSLQHTVRAYPGCRMTFRLTARESNKALSIIDMQMKPGCEPPRHSHAFEDETFIVNSGALTLFVGDDIISAKKGEVVFIPRTVPHSFVVMTDEANCTIIATPGGIENFFELATFPCDTDMIPGAERPPTDAEMKAMNENAARFGISFV